MVYLYILVGPCERIPQCPKQPTRQDGTCSHPCIYQYKEIDGVKCRISCQLGPAPATRLPGEPCLITASICSIL